MKNRILLCAALAGLLLPAAAHAQDTNAAPQPPNWEQLRQELQNLPPEERQARVRELRAQYGNMEIRRPDMGQDRPQASLMAGGAGGGLERVFMVLTPEQRTSLAKVTQEQRETIRDLDNKLRAARKEVLDASLEPKLDEAALRQKLDAVAKLEADLAVLRARAFSKIEPPLTAEQIEQVKNPRPPARVRPAADGASPDGLPPKFIPRNRREIRPGVQPAPDAARDENDLPPPTKP